MDSSNEVVTSPQVDDGATTSSGECNENRHKRIPVQCEEVKEAEAETKTLPCGPETSVFLEEGLFVRIASFCKGKEILRFCTLTKLDMQRKCDLCSHVPWKKVHAPRMRAVWNVEAESTFDVSWAS